MNSVPLEGVNDEGMALAKMHLVKKQKCSEFAVLSVSLLRTRIRD